MKKISLFILIICPFVLLADLPWQNIYFSAAMPDQNIALRCQISSDCEMELFYDSPTGIESNQMYCVPELDNSFQGNMLAPIDSRDYGFRAILADPLPDTPSVLATPVYNSLSQSPDYDHLTWILPDSLGDVPQGNDFLDITDLYASYDDEKLYVAIKNNGGGFPVNDTYFSHFYIYHLIISSHQESDVPFGLMFTANQPPYIQPGLYKMLGQTMEEIFLIGNINYTIDSDNNVLIMECLWQDLLNDEDFVAWFDIDNPEFELLAGTYDVSMSSGLSIIDYSDISTIFPQRLCAQQQTNSLPEISDLFINPDSMISFTYSDPDSNFSLLASATLDDSVTFNLHPQSCDFSQPVTYQSITSHPSLINNIWDHITISVSDNLSDIVSQIFYNQSQHDPDYICLPNLDIQCFPNPFNPQVTISYALPQNIDKSPQISIFNLKGQLIKNFSIDSSSNLNKFTWNAQNSPSGVYLVKLMLDGYPAQTRRITLLK